jgi:hypothetical protein
MEIDFEPAIALHHIMHAFACMFLIKGLKICHFEPISKRLNSVKLKADRKFQTQEYWAYFEDCPPEVEAQRSDWPKWGVLKLARFKNQN